MTTYNLSEKVSEEFLPTEGTWESDLGVVEAATEIETQLSAESGFPVTVMLFREDGREPGDQCNHGQMLATRVFGGVK